VGDLRGSITRWQIWNEPNHYPFVQAPVDPGWYTRLLQAAYLTIKSVDVWTTVLAGGTSPAGNDPNGHDIAPATFLAFVYGFGGKGYFDGFAHHPSSFPCDPMTPADWNSFLQSASIYWTMAAHGEAAKKVWGTEVGAPTGADVGTCGGGNGASVTEPVQAMLTARILTSWTVDFGAFTGPLIWYQVRDDGTNPWVWDQHLGLLRRDYSGKPSFSVFSSMMRG
jgi:polysaccharide biosynthesis protein PslG